MSNQLPAPVEVWNGVLSGIRDQLSEQQFATWFREVRMASHDDDRVEIVAPNSFTQTWLTRNYARVIAKAWAGHHGGEEPEVVVVLDKKNTLDDGGDTSPAKPSRPVVNSQDADEPAKGMHQVGDPIAKVLGGLDVQPAAPAVRTAPAPRPPAPTPARTGTQVRQVPLNPEARLERFCVGEDNRMALAAAKALAMGDVSFQGHLFLHGGVGTGKTHLLQGVAHCLRESRPEASGLYVGAEQFANEYISAIEESRLESFRRRYRSLDLLIVDDVQCLAGKAKTQEEFLHTFNAIETRGGRIVIAGESDPSDLEGLTPRLKSRFQGGMICGLRVPLPTTRAQIAAQKAEAMGVSLAPEVLDFVGELARRSVREVEGAVTRLVGHIVLEGRTIDLEATRLLLSDLSRAHSRRISMEHIADAVCTALGVRLGDLRSASRARKIAGPRQLFMYLSRELTGHSLAEIGSFVGGRDHTTVLYGIDRVTERLGKDGEFLLTVRELQERLRAI